MIRKLVQTKKGSTVAVSIILLSILSSILLYSAGASLHNTVSIEKTYNESRALAVAEGGMEKAIWKLRKDITYSGEVGSTEIQGGKFDVSVTASGSDKVVKVISCVPSNCNPSDPNSKNRKAVKIKVTPESATNDVEFHYGAQVGDLGLIIDNNAAITGGVYSDGDILGGNNGSAIVGDVYAAGVKKIKKVTVTGNVYANTIDHCTIVGDAYYKNWISSTIIGTQHTPSDDPVPRDLPLTQSDIDTWKNEAQAGGTFTGNKTVSGTESIGPQKIVGDLTVQNGGTLNIKGTIWVTGRVNLSNGSVTKVSLNSGESLATSRVIITDGQATVSNLATMLGTGDLASTIMLLSTVDKDSINDPAIDAGNNSVSAVYYASNGMINLSNNVTLNAVVGEGLHLKNNAAIAYSPGLKDIKFSGGPGGKWKIKEWQEVKP